MLAVWSTLTAALFAVGSAGGGACPSTEPGALAQDPTVAAAFENAWKDSKEGTRTEHEEGGWIYQCQGVNVDNPAEWTTIVERWPNGNKDGIESTAVSANPDCDLAAWFHTHPGPAWGHPKNDGFVNERPSTEDLEFSQAYGVPGFAIFGIGSDPTNTSLVAYGPSQAKKPCTPDDKYESGASGGPDSGEKPDDGSGTGGGGSGDGPPESDVEGLPSPDESTIEGIDGVGESSGDPHLVTFDGQHFDFQASGEFVLVRSADGDFEIQTRQQVPSATSHATVNTAVAVRLDGSVIEVAEQRLIVDGEERPMQPTQTISTPGGGTFSGGPGGFTFTWSDGTEAAFLGHSMIVRLSEQRRDEIEGLLGDYDGDAANDLIDERGARLQEDGTITFDDLYAGLAPAWQVDAESSLFTYADGESPATFALDDVPGFGLFVDHFAAADREAAIERCKRAGIEGAVRLADCALDVGVTGDDSFASEARSVEQAIQQWIDESRVDTPLIHAAKNGDAEEVSSLLAAGAEPNEQGSQGRTALHAAAFAGDAQIVGDLLAAGAGVDRRDDNGSTALHIAATFGLVDVAEILIEAGADPNLEDDNGLTPLEEAERQGQDEIAELLR